MFKVLEVDTFPYSPVTILLSIGKICLNKIIEIHVLKQLNLTKAIKAHNQMAIKHLMSVCVSVCPSVCVNLHQ